MVKLKKFEVKMTIRFQKKRNLSYVKQNCKKKLMKKAKFDFGVELFF